MVMMGMSTMFSKAVALFAGFSIMFTPATGFAMDERLAEAFEKTKLMESCDSTGSMKLSVNIESEEMPDDASTAMILDVLKDINIDFTSTQFSSDNNMNVQAYIDYDVKAGIYNIDLKTWMDIDFTDSDNPKMKIIVETPEMLRTMAGIDKQYLLLDYGKIFGERSNLPLTLGMMSENMNSLLKLNDMYGALMGDFEWKDAGNGMYTVTLNNEQTMGLIAEAVDLYINSDYMNAVMGGLGADGLKEELDKISGVLKTLELFADEGIVVDAKVNSDGYIDYQKVKMNMQMDIKDIAEKFTKAYSDGGDVSDMPEIKVGAVFDVEATLTNINSAKEIEFPALTDANSLDVFGSFMTGSVMEAEPVVVFIDGEYMKFSDAKPIVVNDRTLVPARAIIEALGGSMGYSDAEGKETVTGQLGDNFVDLVIGENIAYVNGEAVELDVAAMIDGNDRTMVPLRFVAENLGLTVDYTEGNDTLFVYIYSVE